MFYAIIWLPTFFNSFHRNRFKKKKIVGLEIIFDNSNLIKLLKWNPDVLKQKTENLVNKMEFA